MNFNLILLLKSTLEVGWLGESGQIAARDYISAYIFVKGDV